MVTPGRSARILRERARGGNCSMLRILRSSYTAARRGWSMRITGGRLAGRLLSVPRGEVRPTADRVRESLFARLGSLAGKRVLDLFAGSGALGFEALSRGAAHVVFADRSSAASATLRKSAERLGVADAVEVRRGEARAVLRRLAGHRVFDLVFLDPPYGGGEMDAALRGLVEGALLAPDAL